MAKKTSKPKKAKLKQGVDATELVEKLEKLLNEGRSMFNQPIIDEKEYGYWYDKVLILLRTSFTDPDNEFKNRFVGPASYILVRQDGTSSIQPDNQFDLKGDLGEQLTSMAFIIDEIRSRFVKTKKTVEKQVLN